MTKPDAKDFRSVFTTLCSSIQKAGIEDGDRPGATEVQSAELREAKCRIRTLEQEVVVSTPRGSLLLSGPSAGRMSCPLVREFGAERVPVTVTCRVNKLARPITVGS